MQTLAHEIVSDIKRVASELGRVPTRDEYLADGVGKFSKHKIVVTFGGYAPAVKAAGLSTPSLSRKQKKFRYEPQRIQGFFVHVLDLKELFRRAGNPEVLKLVAQPDTHVPYHDPGAMGAFRKFLKYYKPNVHMIMGDYVDCEGISHWPSSDLEPRRLIPEIVAARKLLGQIVEDSPSVSTRIYLAGNHEDWIAQAKGAKLPELFDGLAELFPDLDPNLSNLLGLEDLEYELFPVNHLVRIGKANFTHGIYTGGSHAKKHVDMFKGNIYYGHLHDAQSHNVTSMDGPMEAQSLGCLCRLDAKFLKGKPNNWVHSFGVFEFFPDGTYTGIVPKIIEGRFSFNGKVFQE